MSVLEFFIQKGFDPDNLGAAGYGQYDPVAPNTTRENKALNRRIEIILVPDLSELPNLVTSEALDGEAAGGAAAGDDDGRKRRGRRGRGKGKPDRGDGT